jgi:long-subunit fatty acid transport protein
VGIGLYLLPRTLVRVIARLPDEPFYPYYDNRTQRLVVLPAVAVKITPRFSLGIGFNVLAGLGGSVIAIEGPTRSLEPRVDEQIDTRLKLNVGARWQISDAHALAVTFRQAFSVPFATVADTVVAGQPLALDLNAEGLYTPDELVLGWAGRLDQTLISADVTWSRWSAYPGPYVHVNSDLPLVGPLAGETPVVPWSDTIGLRLGVEHAFGDWFVRGGYGYETSPVPSEQPGVTNLLDGPKHTFAIGLGVRVGHARIDVHAQAQLVGARTLHKTVAAPGENPAPFDALRDEVTDNPNDPTTLGVQISNPGYPSIDGGGQVYSGGITVEFGL